jgi:hypothetical protein
LPRETHSRALGPKPRVGDVVLYHPEKIDDRDLSPKAAIVHHVRNAATSVVDLTVFLHAGPKVITEVANRSDNVVEGWSFRD